MNENEPLFLTGEALADWQAGQKATREAKAVFDATYTAATFFDGSHAILVARIRAFLDALVAAGHADTWALTTGSGFLTILVHEAVDAGRMKRSQGNRVGQAMVMACSEFAAAHDIEADMEGM
jgi:broad specificity phosphatase PhoE